MRCLKAALILLTWIAPLSVGAESEKSVAAVNGVPITLAGFKKEYFAVVAIWKRSDPKPKGALEALKELADKTLEQLIDREVLCQEGAKLKIEVTESDIDLALKEVGARGYATDKTGRHLTEAEAESRFLAELEQEGLSYTDYRKRLAKQVLAQKVLEREVGSKIDPPAEKEVRSLFDRILAYIRGGSTALPQGKNAVESLALRELAMQIKEISAERVKLSRILVRFPAGAGETEKKKALKDAQRLKERINKGETFTEVAKKESQDLESAPKGGDLGFITRGAALPEIEAVAFKLPVGSVSGPIKTELGYNLLRVTGQRAYEPPVFGRFKDQLLQFLMNLRRAKEAGRFTDSLRSKAVIERNSSSISAAVAEAQAWMRSPGSL